MRVPTRSLRPPPTPMRPPTAAAESAARSAGIAEAARAATRTRRRLEAPRESKVRRPSSSLEMSMWKGSSSPRAIDPAANAISSGTSGGGPTSATRGAYDPAAASSCPKRRQPPLAARTAGPSAGRERVKAVAASPFAAASPLSASPLAAATPFTASPLASSRVGGGCKCA